MRSISFHLLAAGLLCFGPDARACRELVKFDEHLASASSHGFKSYRVARVLEVHPNHILVDVQKRFDGLAIGSHPVTLRFIPNEEAHAICPTRFKAGGRYLIHVVNQDGQHWISRFNGYDIPDDHERFAGYVRDLEGASDHQRNQKR
jgi:hypothetical protein